MSVTLSGMPKPKTPKPATSEPLPPKKSPTDTVRVDADLAFKLNIIVSAGLGRSVSELISPLIRPFVERKYEEAMDALNQKRSQAD